MATDGMNVRDVNIKYIEPATGEVSTKEVPYTQNFDEDTETPEGWKIVRNDDNFGFYVLNVKENGPVWNMKAPSAPNALIAINNALLGAKNEELQDLISIDIKTALISLGEITGEVINDEILYSIFDKFCIGK